MIVAITLLSLLATVAVPMLRLPMIAYIESSARATVTAELDTARGKLNDDLANALPNSIRVTQVGSRFMLEYLDVRAQGRFRSGASGAAQVCPTNCGGPLTRDALEFACSERCFTSLGTLVGSSAPVVNSDWVVVNPLGPGVPQGDPYFGGAAQVANGIKARLTGYSAIANGQRLDITAQTFALAPTSKFLNALTSEIAPASNRFYIVDTPVTYECNPATRQLLRHSNYAIAAAQPTAFGAAQTSPLASTVSACSFTYTRYGVTGAGGVVQMWIRFDITPAGSNAPQAVELTFTKAVSEGVL